MNKVVKYFLQSAIPFRSVGLAGSEVVGSVQRTAERLRIVKEVLARQKERIEEAREAEQEEMHLRNAQRLTSEEIFNRWYAEKGWSEEGLEDHRIMYRRAKFVWLTGAVLCFVTMMVATSLHWLPAMILLSGSVIGVFAFTGRAFMDSLEEARIDRRTMLTIREYVSCADFFKRFLT